MMDAPLLSQMFDLSNLSDAGAELTITATDEQRLRIAHWAGLQAVTDFIATVSLKRKGSDHFAYEAILHSEVVQSCVVTLEPVMSHLALEISRELHLMKPHPGARISEQELSPTSDEGPEEIQDSRYDVAAPLLEEFSLAIDPYPRKPGAALEIGAVSTAESEESPFAALKALKKGE